MSRDGAFFLGLLGAVLVLGGAITLGISVYNNGISYREQEKAALLCRLAGGQPVVNFYNELACVTPNIDRGK